MEVGIVAQDIQMTIHDGSGARTSPALCQETSMGVSSEVSDIVLVTEVTYIFRLVRNFLKGLSHKCQPF